MIMNWLAHKYSYCCLLFTVIILVSSCELSKEPMRPGEVRLVLNEVNSVSIDSHTSEFRLVKQEGDWKVLHKNQLLPAENQEVESLINLLNTINFSEPVTDNTQEWKDYLVDSAGTRITVKTANQTSLDIMIGKFGMESAQVFHTFVRPLGQDYVYSASQFMGINIGRTPENFRNQILARIDRKNLDKIVFNYPDNESFELVSGTDGWQLGTNTIDPLKIKKYLTSLKVVIGVDFYNDSTPPTNLISSIEFRSATATITLNAYSNNDGSWFFNSSENQENFFSDQKILDLFKSKQDFLP